VKRLAPAFLLALATPGCWFLFTDDDGEPPPGPPETPETDPPRVTAIDVADFPPVGPSASVTVHAEAEAGLASLSYQFARGGTVWIYGTTGSVVLTGGMLGEGFGTLFVDVYDSRGGWARTTVESLLVDLSPPEIYFGATVLPPGGTLDAWVGDAWVLGSAELSVGDRTVVEDFPDVYPGTFGTAWDYALVRFPLEGLPEGEQRVVLTARDAAGNVATQGVDLVVDGTPPAVEIASPEPGASVAGFFPVDVHAEDDRGGEVWIDLRLAGGLVASAPGPDLRIEIDASDFVPGTIDLEAIACDEAGNCSPPAVVALLVPGG
jgi:hypothetical protein